MSILIDGATGQAIDETNLQGRGSARAGATTDTETPAPEFPNSPWPAGGGFGPTRQLLAGEPFRLAPWLTVEVCEQELDKQRGNGA
jgi:hypothetical protein